VDGRYAPPAIAPTLVLLFPSTLFPELFSPELPVEVGEDGFEDPGIGVPEPVNETVLGGESGEVVEERETTGGALGVASGSLPAALARVGSNVLSCT